MAEAGLRLTLNSDDPAFIGSSLTDEYLGLAHAFGYGLETLTEVAIAGVDASWLPEDEKSVLRADIAAYAAGRFPTGGADPVS
jgi:adenosine deaminase